MIRAVVARTLAVLLVAAAWSPRPVRADAVVGTGTASSCTEAALNAALAAGGSVTFNCGASPVTITVTSAAPSRATSTSTPKPGFATATPITQTGPSATPAMLSAGDVTAAAGQTAAVPITINTGANNVAFFAVTFTVVPQGGAPAIAGNLTYQAASPLAAPFTSNAVTGSLAIGYLIDISPPLTGTLVIGTLMAPIPAGAIGSYQVQLSRISAGDSSDNLVTLLGQSGTITVHPPFTPTNTPTLTLTLTATQTPTSTPTNTPTHTSTPSPTRTPTPTPPCVGDCNDDGTVTVNEILTMVNIALGNAPVTSCRAGDANHDGEITVDEILAAVNDALNGCG